MTKADETMIVQDTQSPHTLNVHIPSEEESIDYLNALMEAREEEAKVPTMAVLPGNRHMVWGPQDGSQVDFMNCPLYEVLYHGTRGPGKTDALIMSFAQHVGKGHGAAWRGILFRQTYKQLADVQAKSEKWFKQIFGDGAKFNRSGMFWEWDTGEVLLLRHMARPEDYWNYHGHEYPFIGWEELTNWADERCYTSMFACCRSSTKGIPRMVRSTTNPYGPGHTWVKARWRLEGDWRLTRIILDSTDGEGRLEPPRAAIFGHIDENKILLDADPGYKSAIIASATNPAMALAWLEGSWEIVAGGMFSDVWKPKYNIVPEFDIPIGWKITRSFDWGSSAPFSVSWWAESDGSDVKLRNGMFVSTVKGDLFRIHEWYGWTGKPNQGLYMLATEITEGIIEREIMWGYLKKGGFRNRDENIVKAGPADSAIFAVENGMSIAVDMGKPVRVNNQVWKGVTWLRADKSQGSVKTGLEMMRKMMKNAWPTGLGPREKPGLFIMANRNPQFERTVPSLARDQDDMDKIVKGAEDHICDEVRYRVRFISQVVSSSTHVGLF